MDTDKLQHLEGDTLREISDKACSLAALDCGPWFKWRFTRFVGTIYATADHCVFFYEDGEAFTASLSPFANLDWKQEFLFLATQFQGLGMDLKVLFDLMEHLIFDSAELGPRLCINYLQMSARKLIREKIDG